jgi:hypothetical protein
VNASLDSKELTVSNFKKYGLTLEQYNEMKERSKNLCYICSRPPKKRSLCIDHNHKTGKVRGLLCYECNRRLIGKLGDRPNAIELFEKAVQYLKNAEEK